MDWKIEFDEEELGWLLKPIDMSVAGGFLISYSLCTYKVIGFQMFLLHLHLIGLALP